MEKLLHPLYRIANLKYNEKCGVKYLAAPRDCSNTALYTNDRELTATDGDTFWFVAARPSEKIPFYKLISLSREHMECNEIYLAMELDGLEVMAKSGQGTRASSKKWFLRKDYDRNDQAYGYHGSIANPTAPELLTRAQDWIDRKSVV